jgi:hypothetical protein
MRSTRPLSQRPKSPCTQISRRMFFSDRFVVNPSTTRLRIFCRPMPSMRVPSSTARRCATRVRSRGCMTCERVAYVATRRIALFRDYRVPTIGGSWTADARTSSTPSDRGAGSSARRREGGPVTCPAPCLCPRPAHWPWLPRRTLSTRRGLGWRSLGPPPLPDRPPGAPRERSRRQRSNHATGSTRIDRGSRHRRSAARARPTARMPARSGEWTPGPTLVCAYASRDGGWFVGHPVPENGLETLTRVGAPSTILSARSGAPPVRGKGILPPM